jgi:antitoxin component of MazEF toxin-antitoxin module
MTTKKSRNRKIVTIGSSFGVVIPKHVCRLLQLDRTTEISMHLEDDRIVIRAVNRADRARQPDRHRLGRVVTVLVNHYKMGRSEFERLSHDGTSWRAFLADVEIGGYVDPITVARLDECLVRRREVERQRVAELWPDTIDAVLLQIPDDPDVRNAA